MIDRERTWFYGKLFQVGAQSPLNDPPTSPGPSTPPPAHCPPAPWSELSGRERAELIDEMATALYEQRGRITPHCDITIKVQDGKPVLVEITTKHKPTA